MIKEVIDYRGDCWKAYLDVGLCLRILPPGEGFEFIIEVDKLDRVRRVIAHNGGKVVEENRVGEDVQVRVTKEREAVKESHEEDWPWPFLTISLWEKKVSRRCIAGWMIL
jgi:hypothetical protein